ncbi:hypothetical protein FB451DRAFT_1381056 [Mycena latifolia]|nr:hypothetical protein FB451DRAFT_1381056 [Mycena latifolia]
MRLLEPLPLLLPTTQPSFFTTPMSSSDPLHDTAAFTSLTVLSPLQPCRMTWLTNHQVCLTVWPQRSDSFSCALPAAPPKKVQEAPEASKWGSSNHYQGATVPPSPLKLVLHTGLHPVPVPVLDNTADEPAPPTCRQALSRTPCPRRSARLAEEVEEVEEAGNCAMVTVTRLPRLASTSSVPDPLHPHLLHLLRCLLYLPPLHWAKPQHPIGLCWRSCSRCGEHTDHLCHEAPAMAQLRTLPQLPTHLVVSRLAVPCVLCPCPHNIFYYQLYIL